MWTRLRRNQYPTSQALNGLADTAYERVAGGDGMAVLQAPGGLIIAPPPRRAVQARITGAPAGADYPWQETFYNAATSAWEDVADGLSGTTTSLPARERSGDTTVPSGTPVVLYLDDSDTFYWFVASGGGGGGGTPGTITVKEADGTPTYTGVSTLLFDQADGFALSQPGAAQARVDLLPASRTQTGVVNTVTQDFAGQKEFYGAVLCYNDTTSAVAYALNVKSQAVFNQSTASPAN